MKYLNINIAIALYLLTPDHGLAQSDRTSRPQRKPNVIRGCARHTLHGCTRSKVNRSFFLSFARCEEQVIPTGLHQWIPQLHNPVSCPGRPAVA